jgi:hypothetical protein
MLVGFLRGTQNPILGQSGSLVKQQTSLATGLPGTKIFFFVVEPLEVRHGFLTQYLDHHYYTHFEYLYLETTRLLTQLS